jgi:hypothetical protein
MVRRRDKSTPSDFFGVVDRGRPKPPRRPPHLGCARNRRAPEPTKAPAAAWRRLLIVGPGSQHLEVSNRNHSKAFSAADRPRARVPGRRDELGAATIGRRGCRRCRRAAGLKLRVVGPRRSAGRSVLQVCQWPLSAAAETLVPPGRCRAPAALAGLCGSVAGNYRYLRLARDSWLTEEHPISFMSRSISARIRLSAFSTPGRPAAASGNR